MAAAAATFNESVSRLAQYRPFSDEGRDLAGTLEELVVVAALLNGGAFPNLGACQDGIKGLWGIELEIGEVRSVVDRLVEEARGVRIGGGFELTADEIAAKQEIADEMLAIEHEAFEEWRKTVFDLGPALSAGDFLTLCADLRAWLARVVARHGVESALILYPENPRAQKLFEELEALGLSFLPHRGGPLGRLRDRAFQLFVRQPTETQRRFLANLLNTSFHQTVLSLDPAASQLIQERLAGHRVYLDTNFLYSVLGLSNASAVLAANRLLELTRGLGYELAVTPWTIRELRTSLDSAKNRITRRPLPRRELADLMVKAGGDMGNFVTAFWKAYRDRGTQPKDFFEYFSHIESLLESHEIRVVDEGCITVDRETEAINEQLVLLDRYLGWKGREEHIKEHDVKHRLLIERLRGQGNVRFSNARYWFLTEDSKLPRYAMATFDDESVEMPFCVSGSAWAQVVRAFTPRTEDYDRTIVDLLATPYVRYRGALNPRVVEEVVGRVDQFEGADARLASEVLADSALVRDISQAETEEERTDRVQNAFIVKSKQLLERLDQYAEREAQMRETLSEATGEAASEREHREATERALARERADREDAHKMLLGQLELERRERAKGEKDASEALELERERLARQGQEIDHLKRWIRFGAAAVITLIGLLVALSPLSAQVNGLISDSVAVISGVLIVFGGLVVAVGRTYGGRVVSASLALFGFAGGVFTLVDLLHRSG
jgi:hypothetical protein